MPIAQWLGLLGGFLTEPITNRSSSKPRSYAGDASLLNVFRDFQKANKKDQPICRSRATWKFLP